ncbi:MAG TPA: CaiB/BaiF CoA-transferase family protein [Actinospica sp.]|jgi:alpha-methylacyl-CoA racemase|nr:CaiB/BaiF CoA-transferase family protein [Actinospica sp.]
MTSDVEQHGHRHGPLVGLRVLEIASLAPAPFGCTMLSDLGADVLRIDRTPIAPDVAARDPLSRGRRSVAVDLKRPEGAETVLRLAEDADVFVEGFRPGVCERLGIGPETCLDRNPRLIYARMTGYGQDGPMAQRAGHDINYLSLAGALEPLGPASGPPLPPLNYVADFGGGGMLLVVGILAALWERERSGVGQVVDAAMVDGTAMITSILHTLRGAGLWDERRGRNLFDGSAPFYAAYECADGRFVSVGAFEPQFWAELLDGLGLPDAAELVQRQHDRDTWPQVQARLAAIFRTRSRDEWAARFAESDACLTPVLGPFEAHEHPHNVARGTFVEVDGEIPPQPGPAPRFSRTPGRIASLPQSAQSPKPPQSSQSPQSPQSPTDASGGWGGPGSSGGWSS